MSDRFTRRGFLVGAGASALLATQACANAPSTSLRPVARGASLGRAAEARALIDAANLGGHVAFAVFDPRSGRVLEAQDPDRQLPPASVAKAITALYALDRLGPAHRFRTRILATAPVSGGVLQGDLILAGGGDPVLETDDLDALARQLATLGLRELRGRFLVWGGALPYLREIDPQQPDHVGYNPAVAGLALNFNRVHFEWRRSGNGYTTSMDARSARLRPAVQVARMTVVARDLPVYGYAQRGNIEEWSVARSALGQSGSRWLPVRRPALYAADVFRTLTRGHGVRLPEPQEISQLPGSPRQLAVHDSPPLREILRDMLRFSNNMTAEMVGLAASGASGGMPATLRASARDMSRWAQSALGMERVDLVDHSGLGDASRVSVAALGQAMVAAHRDDRLRPILRQFPLRDGQGKVVSNHPIRVDAKTGTLNFVSGLGGYMTTPGGTELAFAIISADLRSRDGIARADREAPRGAREWARRSRQLQQALIERWGAVYNG